MKGITKMYTIEEQQKLISHYISNLFQENFGKSPEGVYVSFNGTFVIIYLRDLISPSEKVLLEQDQEVLVYQMREKLMLSLMPEIKATIQVITGVKLREFYHDWNFHNKSGLLAGISSQPFPAVKGLVEDFHGKKQLDEEIVRISQHAEKVPEELYSCELNPRTLIVIRNGILVRIEKEFIRLGFQDTLKSVKRNLEKTYLHNSSHMESYLGKRIIDIFVDWDLNLDKSLIVFILNPKERMGQQDLEEVELGYKKGLE